MAEKLNLFCLPFAGGNKYSYREFVKASPPFLNLITLEYPGRGARIKEGLISNIDDLINDLYSQIRILISDNNNKYSFYGHSMGGLAAYLLTLKIIENGHNPPVHLFISGTTGPASVSRIGKKRHLLGKKEFVEEIKELGGMPDEILNNDELLNYLEPILRADFMASETYEHVNSEPLDIPITVITGIQEDMKEEDIRLWQQETVHKVDFRKMPGKHFFIYNYVEAIISIITKKLYESPQKI